MNINKSGINPFANIKNDLADTSDTSNTKAESKSEVPDTSDTESYKKQLSKSMKEVEKQQKTSKSNDSLGNTDESPTQTHQRLLEQTMRYFGSKY